MTQPHPNCRNLRLFLAKMDEKLARALNWPLPARMEALASCLAQFGSSHPR